MTAAILLAIRHSSCIHQAVPMTCTWDQPEAPSAGPVFTDSTVLQSLSRPKVQELIMIYADTPKGIKCTHSTMQTTSTLANFGTELHLDLRAQSQHRFSTEGSQKANFLADAVLIRRETQFKAILL